MAGQYDRVVQPGETGKIPIKLSTSKVGGPLTKSVTVTTNLKGSKATIVLKIKGEVWQPVQVTPRSAAFGRITTDKVEQGLVRKLTIVNNVEGELKLDDINVTSPAFKAEVSVIKPGKKYELTVTAVPPLKQGNNSGKITMSTGIAGTPKLQIPVYAYVTAPVDVSPSKLSLPVARSQDLTRQFYIRSNTNEPIKITDLKSSSPELKMQLTNIRNSLTYRLTVDVPTSYKPAPGGDTISFKTDNSAVPSISIPITQRRLTAKKSQRFTRPPRVVPSIARSRGIPKGTTARDKTAQAKADAQANGKKTPPPTDKKGSQPAGH